MPLGSIVGGLIGAGGAQAQGAAAGAAGGRALATSYDVGNRDVARLSPWVGAGMNAEDALSQLYGLGALKPIGDQYNTYGTPHGYGTPEAQQEQQDALGRFQTSPGYQFRLQQGVNALDRSASSKGMNFSGAQGKALTDYGQNTGSAEYGNYIGQLNALAGGGASAATNTNSAYNGALGQGINDAFAGSMGQANSYQNSANALANGIGSGVNSLMALGAFGYGNGWFGGGGGVGANAGGMAGNPMTTGLGGF